MAQNQNQTLVAEAPERLAYTPDVVARMRVAIGKEIDDIRAAGRNRMAQLQQAMADTDAQMRREVAELEQAMRDIVRDAVPTQDPFPGTPDLADNPDANIAVINGLHNAQDAREGVTR